MLSKQSARGVVKKFELHFFRHNFKDYPYTPAHGVPRMKIGDIFRSRMTAALAGAVLWASATDSLRAEHPLWNKLRPTRPTPTTPWTEPSATPEPGTIIPEPATKTPTTQPTPTPMPMPEPMTPQAPAEPRFEPLVSAALGDNNVAVNFHPAMFGDLNGSGKRVNATLPGGTFIDPFDPVPTTPQTPATPGSSGTSNTNTTTRQRDRFQVPSVSYAGFKIAENESPRPTDRIFATYNYYNGVPTSPSSPSFDVHRETLGFEKTFLDGQASIGVRVPFLQLTGPSDLLNDLGLRDGQFGDVSIIAKYAYYDDRTTGNLLSAGVVITAPTGEAAYIINDDEVHSTLIQPWLGGIWNFGDFFVHGFSSVVIPTDSRDVTAWFNDVGLSYWLRKDQRQYFFHGIIPTIEAHLGTPLTNRQGNDLDSIRMSDYMSLLGGVNFVFARNSTVGIAAGAPVIGPRPWQFESHVSINFRF